MRKWLVRCAGGMNSLRAATAPRRPAIAGLGLAALAAAMLTVATGCVERALVVTSEPSGADITVNQQWKGKTPYVLPFKHYGVYDIWIEHPGLEENGKMVKFYPLHVGEPVKAPGYQHLGADFITEVILPTTFRDQRNLHYVLERVDKADDVSDVLARASQLRDASQARTEMRYAKDIERGRDPGPSPGYEGSSSDYYQDGTSLTPPSPTEVPLYLP